MHRLLILLLAACAAPTPQDSAPPKTPEKQELKAPFTFALYGDCRGGHSVHEKICAQLLKSDAKFVLQTGDIVADGSQKDQWDRVREITKPLREKIPYHPAKGNHDLGKERYFETEFGLESSSYTVRQGPVDFFFIDSNRLNDEQIAWLKEKLAASTAAHKVAVFHHPCFTLVAKRYSSAKLFKDKVHALFVESKLCAVFNGHDHLFYSTVRDGLRYITTGGAGAPLYDLDEKLAEKGDLYGKFHHYLLIDVQEKSMAAQVHDLDGKKKDGFGFPLCKH